MKTILFGRHLAFRSKRVSLRQNGDQLFLLVLGLGISLVRHSEQLEMSLKGSVWLARAK
jgi:hypothetical protein